MFGFTETALLPDISAAGRTPDDRRWTALADAEYLLGGANANPRYPLPPLAAGASPAVISQAVVSGLSLPLYVLDAGLPATIPQPQTLPQNRISGSLAGVPARCLTTASAMSVETVRRLFEAGWAWGDRLAEKGDYAIVGECVVGGTTTALAVLLGLGIEAEGMVNSSYPHCNHQRKQAVVREGLQRWQAGGGDRSPWGVVMALGDPMQVAVAGLTLALSRRRGVLLAGGTQMLAVYALARAIADWEGLTWNPEQVVVGTTRWVAEDPTGATVRLAERIGGVSLLATPLNFTTTRYPQLQAYERGYVKEGVGAGGCAIAATLCGWTTSQLVREIEATFAELERRSQPSSIDSG